MDTCRRTVVLHSGGLDSSTVLAIAKAEGYEAYALSFSYGQRHNSELEVDYGLTLSYYDPTPAGESCGHCDACLLRIKGLSEAGVPDSTLYRPSRQAMA